MEILQLGKFKYIKKCPKCNEENDKDANWCLQCGKAILSVEVRRCQQLKGDAKPYIPLSYKNQTKIITDDVEVFSSFSPYNWSVMCSELNDMNFVNKAELPPKNNATLCYTHSALFNHKSEEFFSDNLKNSVCYKTTCQGKKKIESQFYSFDDSLNPVFTICNPMLGYVFPLSNTSSVEVYNQQQLFKNEKHFYQKVHHIQPKKRMFKVHCKSLQKIKSKSVIWNSSKLVTSSRGFTTDKKTIHKISAVVSSHLPFPDEVLLRIMSYLTLSDIMKMLCVCKQLYRIGMDDSLWKVIRIKRQSNLTDITLAKIAKRYPAILSISQCNGKNLTEDGLKHLFQTVSASLKDFSISGCSGGILNSEAVLIHVAVHCKNIETLDISWSNVTDVGITALCNSLPRLVYLLLNGCQGITNESMVKIADKYSGSLEMLEIFGCFNVSPQAINKLIENCTLIRKLNLGQCHKVTNYTITLIAKHLRKIQSLDIRGCKQVRDVSLREIIENCHELSSLVVANCPAVTDITLYWLSTQSPMLRNLDACGCGKITDKGVSSLVKGCTNLQSLDLSSTKVTGRSVTSISTYCRNTLQSLRLSFCNGLTDASLYALVSRCQKLRTLHLYGCKTVRNPGKLIEMNPKLCIENESLR